MGTLAAAVKRPDVGTATTSAIEVSDARRHGSRPARDGPAAPASVVRVDTSQTPSIALGPEMALERRHDFVRRGIVVAVDRDAVAVLAERLLQRRDRIAAVAERQQRAVR